MAKPRCSQPVTPAPSLLHVSPFRQLRASRRYAGGDAPASHSPGEDGGNKVSHGASEKQRRDRINAMIDQLRVIGARHLRSCAHALPVDDADDVHAVPSDAPRSGKGAGSSGDVGEGRRSKFVVLQQTINTLKSLQLRCAAQEEELARLRGAAPPAPPAASNGRSAGSAPAELPSLPTAHGVPGVEVHQGSDTRTCFVRVSTMDRRGLLADILNALRAMPLEVVRAAITTSADGRVSDCFELRLASGAGGGLRRDDIKRAVELQLLAAAADDDADEGKRRKTSVTRAASAAARR